MLESTSRANERPTVFSREANCAQCAFHAAIGAAGAAPDRIAFRQATFGRVVIQTIGIEPERFRRDSESFRRMGNGCFSCYVIFVLRIVVGYDSNPNGALHISQSVLENWQ